MVPPDDDSRAPGTPSGLSAIIETMFGEPEKPTLTRAEVIALVEKTLVEHGITADRLDVSDAPVRRNALSDAAGRRVPFPEGVAYDRCFVVLVDHMADALWAHPARWAFVPADGKGQVELRDTRLPAHSHGTVRLVPGR